MPLCERLETSIIVLLALLQLLDVRLHATEKESQAPLFARNVGAKNPIVLHRKGKQISSLSTVECTNLSFPEKTIGSQFIA